MTISINPIATTNGAGLFNVDTVGAVQGTAQDDPVARFKLNTGVLASTETLPMWGGVAITESIRNLPAASYNAPNLGNLITRALNVTANNANTITGFSVFDQAYSMVASDSSPVPLASNGMSVHYYRLGSGARLWVKCDPGLAAALLTGVIVPQVSWDFNDQLLQAYSASATTLAVTSLTWSSTNGGQVAVVLTSTQTIIKAVGDTIDISGISGNTGTGGNPNGAYLVNTFTDSQHFTFLLPGTSAVWGTFSGTIVINIGSGALAVDVIDVNIGKSMTVNYNSTTNAATWNYADTTALIIL